jgi:nucleotide-binding universal stress UspA family protein
MSIFPTRVLLATDGSKDAELATTTAVDLANNTSCELHIVYVEQAVYVPGGAGFWSGVPSGYLEQQARKQLDAMVEKVRSAGGEVAEAHLRVGNAAPEIVALAEEIEAGLMVMGSRGQGGIRRALIGSVSEAVVRHVHCPVLVVRH